MGNVHGLYHISVLGKIDQSIRPQLSADESLYTDLQGLKAQENPTSAGPPPRPYDDDIKTRHGLCEQ